MIESKMTDENYSDLICNVIKENQNFLHENADDAVELVDLMNDTIDYVGFSVKRKKEEYVKSSMAFFIHHILMPYSYAIYVDLLTGNLPACFMELRLMLESLAKCYLADLKYPERTFFQEKLEELDKEDKSISKMMGEAERELKLRKGFVALWGKLSNDWVHARGLFNRIVNKATGNSGMPAWTLIIPMNFHESDLPDINELRKRISQFRILLKATMEKFQQGI